MNNTDDKGRARRLELLRRAAGALGRINAPADASRRRFIAAAPLAVLSAPALATTRGDDAAAILERVRAHIMAKLDDDFLAWSRWDTYETIRAMIDGDDLRPAPPSPPFPKAPPMTPEEAQRWWDALEWGRGKRVR